MPSYDSKNDPDIFKHAARCMYFRALDMAELTGRSRRVIQRRMKKLVARGYFTTTECPYNTDEFVHYLTRAGWDRALEIGATDYDDVRVSPKKPGLLRHDLQLTRLYVAWYRVLGDRILRWSQLYRSRKLRYGNGKEDYVNMDAVAAIRFDEGIAIMPVEVENQNGVKEPIKKMRGYVRLIKSGKFEKKFGDYSCIVTILKENEELVVNVLKAAHEDREVNLPMFLLTTYDAPLTFRTPADFEERTWGFQDLGALV